MKHNYLIVHNVGGDTFPVATCANRADAEELCLACAQEELYRRYLLDEYFAKPKGFKSIFIDENKLINMNYNVLEVPHFD